MRELIDREVAIKNLEQYKDLFTWDDGDRERAILTRVIKELQSMPFVKARETECWKCYWSEEKGCSIFCRAWNRYTAHGGYCHQYADRRGDSDDSN